MVCPPQLFRELWDGPLGWDTGWPLHPSLWQEKRALPCLVFPPSPRAPEEGKREGIQAIPTWEVDRRPEGERGADEVLPELRTGHSALSRAGLGLHEGQQQSRGDSELQGQLSLTTLPLKASSEPILVHGAARR